MLHAFGHAYSPWSDMAGSFRAELIKRSPEPIDLYEISLDTARVQDPKDEGPFVEYIRAVLAGRKLDLIAPVGAPAAFLHATLPAAAVSNNVHADRWSGRAAHLPRNTYGT
jgi:hypothetical protein